MKEDFDTHIPNLVNAASSIYKVKQDFGLVFVWSLLSSIFTISVGTLFALYIFLPKAYGSDILIAVTSVVIALGIPVFIFAFVNIFKAYGSSKLMNSFYLNFYPIWLKTRFDLLPPKGESAEEVMENKIRGMIPTFKRAQKLTPSYRGGALSDYDVILRKRKEIALVKVLKDDEEINPELFRINRRNLRRFKFRLLLVLIRPNMGLQNISIPPSEVMSSRRTAFVFVEREQTGYAVRNVIPPLKI